MHYDSGRQSGQTGGLLMSSEPRGNRTPNPLIKSQLLCLIELAAHDTDPLYLVLQALSNRCAFQGRVANHRMTPIRHLFGRML